VSWAEAVAELVKSVKMVERHPIDPVTEVMAWNSAIMQPLHQQVMADITLEEVLGQLQMGVKHKGLVDSVAEAMR
jgi:hypothetical protein